MEELYSEIIKKINNSNFAVEPSRIFGPYVAEGVNVDKKKELLYSGNYINDGNFESGYFDSECVGIKVYGEIHLMIRDKFFELDLFDFDGYEYGDLYGKIEHSKTLFECIDFLIILLTSELRDFVPFKNQIFGFAQDAKAIADFTLDEVKSIIREVLNFTAKHASEFHEFFLPKPGEDEIMNIFKIKLKAFLLRSGLIIIDNDRYSEDDKGEPMTLNAGSHINSEGYVPHHYETIGLENFAKGIEE